MLIGALSCTHKGPKCIQTLWDHQKKFFLLKSTKKSRYVRSLGKKPHFEAFPEAKKANWRSQLHAQRSKMHSNPLGPSEKKIILCKSTKKARYVRSLGKKTHFGAFPEAKKGVARAQVR